MADAPAAGSEPVETVNNDLFERLPFLADAILTRLDSSAVLQLSCTCHAWRKAVQLSQESLAPKSELAMPFVASCVQLRRLQLSHMQPAPGPSSSPNHGLLHYLAHLTGLTHLDLARSLTAAWRGQVVQVTPDDLAHLTGCTALQVLNLSHQPCLLHPDSLSVLAHLPALTSLQISISGTNWVPHIKSWHALSALTGIRTFDLSGWSKCRVELLPTDEQQLQQQAEQQQEGQQQQQQQRGSYSSESGGTWLGAAWNRLTGHRHNSHDHHSHAHHSHEHNVRGQAVHGPGPTSNAADATVNGITSPVVVAGAPSAAAASHQAAAAAGGDCCGASHTELPAPLEMLGSCTHLQELLLTHWTELPSSLGVAALMALPHLTFLDLSNCLTPDKSTASNTQPNSSSSSSSRQQASLLALLQGTTWQQQQQQQQQVALRTDGRSKCGSSGLATAAGDHSRTAMVAAVQQDPNATSTTAAAAAAAAAPAAVPAPACAPPFFSSLQRLTCSGVGLMFEAGLWSALQGLTHLDVSACDKFKGAGLTALTVLQDLVASDCIQLDYDALKELLMSARNLQRLDLTRSTIIIQGSGRTAVQLNNGQYTSSTVSFNSTVGRRRPVQHAGGSQGGPLQMQLRQQVAGSSRRDVADVSGAEEAPGASGSSPAAAVGGEGIATSTAAAAAEKTAGIGEQVSNSRGLSGPAAGNSSSQGLQQLLMSECQLAFEAFMWQPNPNGGRIPPFPSLLLYDMVECSAHRLQNLQSLHWDRADTPLASVILSHLVPSASNSLTALHLSSSSLPEDPAQCWQGLAAATKLRVLDLNDTGIMRLGYAQPCGTNPTVALLLAVARMRLEVLRLARWRFYFATLKPLAGLSDCLVSLDLTRGRDVTDSTLWSLTHLTSLTWLSVSGARISNDQIFSLILHHLPDLQHVDLSGISKFTSRSIPSLLQLSALTSLDIRSTQATADEAAVSLLVKLPKCRRLALSIAGDGSYGRPQQWPVLPEVSSSRGSTPHSSIDIAGVEAGGGLQAYAYLGQLGRAQSLRQVLLGGSTPSLTEYCRSLLPPWIDVR